ncbi:beta family protein [Metapseudomonas resinovorans]|uniref:Beta protein n=1 Tax=Metapseudomonas resinovorans NBRC 106553 TaxID=1245471 RepID=S6B1M3_METRE|nr:beta family protein [Pseudomonas resinovorans]BAN51106.1 hypothetical protein PCA10_53740 [Pseudomonas resinovorans NBRC 106553]
MTPRYVPLLKALDSECQAIVKMGKSVADSICPLFEVPRIGKNITEAKRFEGCTQLKMAYLNEITDRIAITWKDRPAMVDAYQWQPGDTVESGEHIVQYMYGRLASLGVDVIPVIGYDRWDNQAYRLAVQKLDPVKISKSCIRLDAQALEDSEEPDFFEENIESILDGLALEPAKCSILIDFGDATGWSVEGMIEKTEAMLAILEKYGFKYIVTAGCSLPKSIDLAVKKPDTTGIIPRKEMLLWQAMRQSHPKSRIVYGDYGVRGPTSNEGVRNPHANGKIRHTIDKHFFIVRGHSMKLPGKGQQMWGLAKTVVDSQHYMGEEFSWGDKRIYECSQKKCMGGHPQWITNDTSHHLAYAVAEVHNFELSVMATGNLEKTH